MVAPDASIAYLRWYRFLCFFSFFINLKLMARLRRLICSIFDLLLRQCRFMQLDNFNLILFL